LALAIEHSALTDQAPGSPSTLAQLLHTHTQAMGIFGSQPGQMDTLVLGCTHYVFVEKDLQQLLGPEVRLVSTGEPVARQTRRLLDAAGLLRVQTPEESMNMLLLTTGDLKVLQAAASRWLSAPADRCAAVTVSLTHP
jgi:glutamate racemase